MPRPEAGGVQLQEAWVLQPLSAADPANPPTPRRVAMNWARRLKRVFGIEIEGCAHCGGKLKIIASIEEPEVISA